MSQYEKFKELITKIGFTEKIFKNIILTRYDYKDYRIQIDIIFSHKEDGTWHEHVKHRIYVTKNNKELFSNIIETEYGQIEQSLKYEFRVELRKEKLIKLLYKYNGK